VSPTRFQPTSRVGDHVPVELIEEQHIRSVLASTKSLQQAGEILGMDYQTLYRRRKLFGIDTP
jgi:NtrC-family two-component system response regulator AlgB